MRSQLHTVYVVRFFKGLQRSERIFWSLCFYYVKGLASITVNLLYISSKSIVFTEIYRCTSGCLPSGTHRSRITTNIERWKHREILNSFPVLTFELVHPGFVTTFTFINPLGSFNFPLKTAKSRHNICKPNHLFLQLTVKTVTKLATKPSDILTFHFLGTSCGLFGFVRRLSIERESLVT